jgi:hypothetical protein
MRDLDLSLVPLFYGITLILAADRLSFKVDYVTRKSCYVTWIPLALPDDINDT